MRSLKKKKIKKVIKKKIVSKVNIKKLAKKASTILAKVYKKNEKKQKKRKSKIKTAAELRFLKKLREGTVAQKHKERLIKLQVIKERILGKKSILFKDKINWKYPDANGFEPHQDAQVWENLYKNVRSFLSMTISIDKTTVKNGCLEVVEKKHKEGLFGDNKTAIPKHIVKKFKWKKITTQPGDLILFGAYTPHRSKKNNTNKARKMMYLSYNAKKDGDLRKKYFKDKRKNYPPNNERIPGNHYKYLI